MGTRAFITYFDLQSARGTFSMTMVSCPPSAWSVAVIIPARDESGTIALCLLSILSAIDQAAVTDSWIVVVADDCTDDTAQIAKTMLGYRGEVIECCMRSPGSARLLGTQAALRHFQGRSMSRVWLANTDADTEVPGDWIAQHLDFADQGCAGVAGIVRISEIQGLRAPNGISAVLDYPIEEDGTHPHVHGANLGIRADAYRHVGGWKAVEVGEDHCLWNRLRAEGWALVSAASSVVTTSGRTEGRAVGGFADLLKRQLNVGSFSAPVTVTQF